jgi:hypothetical protein
MYRAGWNIERERHLWPVVRVAFCFSVGSLGQKARGKCIDGRMDIGMRELWMEKLLLDATRSR